MPDGKFDREFLRAALMLTTRSEVDRLLLVSDHPLSLAEIRGRPIKKKLVYAVTADGLAHQLKAKKYNAVVIPPYDYTRVEKLKVAIVAAQSSGLLRDGDTVLACCGPGNDKVADTMIKAVIGAEDPEEKIRVDTLGLPPEFSSQVVEGLIHTAMEIGAEG
jgi:diadenylate cyclase